MLLTPDLWCCHKSGTFKTHTHAHTHTYPTTKLASWKLKCHLFQITFLRTFSSGNMTQTVNLSTHNTVFPMPLFSGVGEVMLTHLGFMSAGGICWCHLEREWTVSLNFTLPYSITQIQFIFSWSWGCFQEQIHFIRDSAKYAPSDFAIPHWPSQRDVAVIQSKIMLSVLQDSRIILNPFYHLFLSFWKEDFLEDSINYWNYLPYLSFKKFYVFIFGCAGSSLLCEQGLLCSCRAQWLWFPGSEA